MSMLSSPSSSSFTRDHLQTLESCASILGVLIGISVFTVYFTIFQRLKLNVEHSHGFVELQKAKFALDQYSKMKSRSTYKTNYISNNFCLPKLPYVKIFIEKMNRGNIDGVLFMFSGILFGILFKAIRIILEHKRVAKINSDAQQLAREISHAISKSHSSIQQVQSEAYATNKKYERRFSNEIEKLDAEYFDVHEKLFEKLIHLQRLVIERCSELVHKYRRVPQSEEIIRSAFNECLSTIFKVMSDNMKRKYDLQSKKHRQLNHKQGNLLDFEDSPFYEGPSSDLVNEDLRDIKFNSTNPIISSDDLKFEPKMLSLSKKKGTEIVKGARSHSRSSSILKSIELHTDSGDIGTSTPFNNSSSYYSNSLIINGYYDDVFESNNEPRLKNTGSDVAQDFSNRGGNIQDIRFRELFEQSLSSSEILVKSANTALKNFSASPSPFVHHESKPFHNFPFNIKGLNSVP